MYGVLVTLGVTLGVLALVSIITMAVLSRLDMSLGPVVEPSWASLMEPEHRIRSLKMLRDQRIAEGVPSVEGEDERFEVFCEELRNSNKGAR